MNGLEKSHHDAIFGAQVFVCPHGRPNMRLKERLMMKLTINATLRMVMVMLTGVGMASLVSAVPASAQNVVIDLGKTILGIEDEKPELDYRPRPPLVIPPKMELPKPIDKSVAKSPQWPNDPDVAAQRAAAEARRKPVQKIDTSRPLGIDEVRAGRVAGAGVPTAPAEPVAPRNMSAWIPPSELKMIEEKIKLSKAPELTPGYEPPRQWLTDPPKGYRKPVEGVAVIKPKVAPTIRDEREESSPLAVFRKPKQNDDD
jgi:hypothetical protein